MPTGLKFLIANCVLIGWNIATFLFDLLDKRLWWAVFAACAVPVSLWGIHSSLKLMRAESARSQLAFMRSFMEHIASAAADNGAKNSDNPS